MTKVLDKFLNPSIKEEQQVNEDVVMTEENGDKKSENGMKNTENGSDDTTAENKDADEEVVNKKIFNKRAYVIIFSSRLWCSHWKLIYFSSVMSL